MESATINSRVDFVMRFSSEIVGVPERIGEDSHLLPCVFPFRKARQRLQAFLWHPRANPKHILLRSTYEIPIVYLEARLLSYH